LKKGFASLLIGALVVLLLVLAAGAQLVISSAQDSAITVLDARRVADRVADANYSFAAAFTDALFDSAYGGCGCGGVNPSIVNASVHSNATSYFNNLSGLLSDARVTVNYSGLNISSVTVSSCAGIYTYQFNYTILANSTDVSYARNVYDNRSVGILRGTGWARFNITRASSVVAVVNVTC